MGVGLRLATGANLVLRLHQRPLLLALLLVLGPPRPAAGSAGLVLLSPHLHPLHWALVNVHGPQRLAHAEEEDHEPALGEAGVVDEVGVDHVLQVAPAVVGQQDVDGLVGLVAAAAADVAAGRGAALGGDAVVDHADDGGYVGEDAVGVDLAHGLLDRLGAEGAAYLLEGEELVRGRVLDEVDVGEAALAEEPEDLEAAAVDLERRGAGEAVEAIANGVEEVKYQLRHGELKLEGERVCVCVCVWFGRCCFAFPYRCWHNVVLGLLVFLFLELGSLSTARRY